MKKLIMIAMAAMLALNLAAEDKKAAPKKGARGNIFKELNLTKEQAAKMKEVNAEFGPKLKELSKEDRKTKKGRELSKARQEAIAKILTEEQQAKLKELMAKRRPAGKDKKKPQEK